ncbi:hypothetical protein EWB00_000560 [Schistosoma japonicum]|uniref:Uncharacterized protein n=1 Tax=Schistosoma japonicum TaxID=6182 RepID=A0A4Z2DIE6_SCHJA|nr:hypothetical protein KSF78_0009381 [Schistosoma japonicum]TNN16281.1 hypothetical protein EWB00_000560 [Schistosoma japonicum]
MVRLLTISYLLVSLLLSYIVLISGFVLQSPLKFDSEGNRKVIVGQEKFSLNSKNQMEIQIDDCQLIMDFTLPNKTELTNRKGLRKVVATDGCKKIFGTLTAQSTKKN